MKVMSPRAFIAASGRNGAMGAKLHNISPAACPADSGSTWMISQARAGPATQPQKRVGTKSVGLFNNLTASFRSHSRPPAIRLATVNTTTVMLNQVIMSIIFFLSNYKMHCC